MTTASAGLVARAFAVLAILSTAVALALRPFARPGVADPLDLIILAEFAVFGVIGWLIVARRPKNTIGWIFLAVAVAASLLAVLGSVAGLGRFSSSSLARVGAWLEGWIWVPMVFVPTIFPFLLFPDGRLPSRRWRSIVWIGAVGVVAFSFAMAFYPDGFEGGRVPIALRPPPGIVDVASLGGILLLAALVGGLVATAQRFRRSRGEERQQLRWLAYAGILGAGVLTAAFIGGGVLESLGVDVDDGPVGDALNLLILLSVLAIPVAMTVAILKYRLYDIDIVIRKTVVYAVLAGLIFVVGAGLVRLMTGVLVGGRGGDALLLAGILIGLLVWPLRRVALRIADRLVFGGRASPYEVLSAFSGRVAETYAADDVLERMAQVLAAGVGAEAATVWLRARDGFRPGAIWPSNEPRDGVPPPSAIEVPHRDEVLGALSVRMPANDPMNPTKDRLIRDLAAQAGLVLRNAGLIEDLKASRQRIVTAQDERAKKLERNIHDGAQQQLVALAVKQRLAASLIGKDDDRARALQEELQAETTQALEDLRDLARGIYPPLLADKGLEAAIESQIRKSSVPVAIESEGIGRYAAETESAVYFSVLESLQNVAKYAEASRATVRMSQVNGTLSFEVEDDGRGFDPAVTGHGSGLQGIADRVAALGGAVEFRSAPGAGTTITGRIPSTPPEGAG
jgi:signal transduction histidine kinase